MITSLTYSEVVLLLFISVVKCHINLRYIISKMARNKNTPALYGEWEFSEKVPLIVRLFFFVLYPFYYQTTGAFWVSNVSPTECIYLFEWMLNGLKRQRRFGDWPHFSLRCFIFDHKHLLYYISVINSIGIFQLRVVISLHQLKLSLSFTMERTNTSTQEHQHQHQMTTLSWNIPIELMTEI
jgi:hypothetical protein